MFSAMELSSKVTTTKKISWSLSYKEFIGRFSESYFCGLTELESKLRRTEKSIEEARLDPLWRPFQL